ncbi:8348_t:CDS:2 [Funneliformis caledonium]|uniref:8348_t:CDS:1 n=1 Tax=Funneliformis caledonium TaxID=1117310 RepID=A0A9N9D3A4_9GLOM|nr:8348_t:CDS:2 [Funneliformis caledonium]
MKFTFALFVVVTLVVCVTVSIAAPIETDVIHKRGTEDDKHHCDKKDEGCPPKIPEFSDPKSVDSPKGPKDPKDGEDGKFPEFPKDGKSPDGKYPKFLKGGEDGKSPDGKFPKFPKNGEDGDGKFTDDGKLPKFPKSDDGKKSPDGGKFPNEVPPKKP